MNAATIPLNRLYGDLAYLSPLVNPPEDYVVEVHDWIDTIRDHCGEGRKHILELGVGGGSLLRNLTGEFDATAVDLSDEMLRVAAEVNPGVTFHSGDMRTIRLGRTFDVVIIHDAISYMTTETDLAAVFGTASAHLDPGGLFITSPDYTRETFREPGMYTCTRSDGITDLTFVQYDYDPDPDDTVIESVMTYFIKSGSQLSIEHDRHITGLFSKDTWLHQLEKAGFHVTERPCAHIDEPGHILLIGIRC